jgi:hypothetical protein
VAGQTIRKISLVGSGVVGQQEILSLNGLVLTGGCAVSGVEDVIASTSVTGGEISSFGFDASTAANVAAVFDDNFIPGDTNELTPANTTDVVYETRYNGGDGRPVVVSLSTEDDTSGNNCVISGFAIG